MSVAVITGSAGLIGSEAARFFAGKGLDVVGVDNDLRRHFFGEEASTAWNRRSLERELRGYRHVEADIRDNDAISGLFRGFGREISVVIHAASQPSHDWAARDPRTDFEVNASGTLNLLEASRRYCPDTVFIFLSTNKVYGDTPNKLPLSEQETRWELDPGHPYSEHGIDERMTLDRSLHSLFGVSKTAADLLVQEYGRYFGMKTICFRGGCLAGPGHSGAHLHGFLAYLVKCAVTDRHYTIHGYKGKQVRDNMHSFDLATAMWRCFRKPRIAEVYNIGGGRQSNCSILEAISQCEALTGRPMSWSYAGAHRIGDHIWWISDRRKFESHYPDWRLTYSTDRIIAELYDSLSTRRKA